MAVLRPPGDVRPFEPLVILAALYGDVTFPVPVAVQRGSKPRGETQLVFGVGARFGLDSNTVYSAVATLRRFNPSQRHLDEEIRGSKPSWRGDVDAVGTIGRIVHRLSAAGVYLPDALVPRLDVFHNAFATVPLPLEMFGGPHDGRYTEGRTPAELVYGARQNASEMTGRMCREIWVAVQPRRR